MGLKQNIHIKHNYNIYIYYTIKHIVNMNEPKKYILISHSLFTQFENLY